MNQGSETSDAPRSAHPMSRGIGIRRAAARWCSVNQKRAMKNRESIQVTQGRDATGAEKQLVPKIRFGEFEGEYRPQKFGKSVIESAFGPRFSSNEYVEDGRVVCLRTTDMTDDGEISFVKAPRANLSQEFSCHFLQKGDLVITRSGTIGVTGLFNGFKLPVVPGAFMIRFRLDKSRIDGFFIKTYFNSFIGRKKLVQLSAGGVQKNLKGTTVKKLELFLPTLPEQQKIATFLTAVDGRLRALRRKRELLLAYKRGVMGRVFDSLEGKSRFVEFGEIAQRSKDRVDPKAQDQDLPCVELEHLSQNTGIILGYITSTVQKSSKNRFLSGQVLYSKLRPYLNKYAHPQFDGVCSSEIWVLQGRKVSNDFLFYLVQSSRFRRAASISSGSKMPRASWDIVSLTTFSVPSSSEQNRISTFLQALDNSIALVDQQLAGTETFKRGLLQKMFV